jgi:predicted DCC family thiol-disulfide oxidoreductase YuxK
MSVITEPEHARAAAATGGWLRVAGLGEIFGVDLRTLALFRVGLAAMILLDLALRTRDLTAFHTDFGAFPRYVATDNLHPWAWSLHLAGGSALFIGALFAVAAVFGLMLLVGYRTRLASVASWAMLLSLQNRNTMILTGEDVLLIALAFWAMFLPLGARFSVDAALDPREKGEPNAYCSVATAALLLQGMSMYLFSALLKSDARWMPDGTAVYYALQLDYFATPFAHWLRELEPLLTGLTYYVWLLELLGPLLIFSPLLHRQLRGATQLAFISMHVGFFLCLEIGLFPAVSILMNLTFTQGWVWDRLAARYGRASSRGLTIWYDGPCDFCRKTCAVLRTFLILPGTPIRPAQGDADTHALMRAHDSWVVRDGQGQAHVRWEAMVLLVQASPLLAPLAKLMATRPAMWLGERTYAFVAARRGGFGRITARALPWRENPVTTPRWREGLAGAALLFITFQNVSTVPEFGVKRPELFVAVREGLRLYQSWGMFAPYPEVTSPWPVIAGVRRDGTPVDVYHRAEGAPSFDKPAFVARTYETYRWRRFLTYIEDMSYSGETARYGLEYARWLCRSWNAGAPPDQQLAAFDIYFMVEWTRPYYFAKHPEKRKVWSHDCFG